MDFCIGTCAKIDQVDLVKQAEDLGVTHFGVGEGPLLFTDPYQQLALASAGHVHHQARHLGHQPADPDRAGHRELDRHPERARARPHVPRHRHREQRAALDGQPPRHDQGARPVGQGIRGLLRGERVTHRWLDQDREIEFLDPNGLWYDIADVPIWMAAGGPKGLKATAALADSVIYCLGPQPDMIGVVRRELDKAVADAGRPPGSVKLVALSWFYQLRPGETWEDGIDQGFGSGPISSCITNAGFMNEHIDELGADRQRLHPGRDGLPRRPHRRRRPALPRGLGQVPARARPGPPAADHQGAGRLLVPVRRPGQTSQEKTQLMLDAGVDMVSVFLSNPFTAERDIADIGSSILAHA